jgi:hypothetical protein
MDCADNEDTEDNVCVAILDGPGDDVNERGRVEFGDRFVEADSVFSIGLQASAEVTVAEVTVAEGVLRLDDRNDDDSCLQCEVFCVDDEASHW